MLPSSSFNHSVIKPKRTDGVLYQLPQWFSNSSVCAESPGGWAHPRVPGLAGPRQDQESAFLTGSQAAAAPLPLGGGLDLQNHLNLHIFNREGVATKEVKSGFWGRQHLMPFYNKADTHTV